jgi:hypothetical protein
LVFNRTYSAIVSPVNWVGESSTTIATVSTIFFATTFTFRLALKSMMRMAVAETKESLLLSFGPVCKRIESDSACVAWVCVPVINKLFGLHPLVLPEGMFFSGAVRLSMGSLPLSKLIV